MIPTIVTSRLAGSRAGGPVFDRGSLIYALPLLLKLLPTRFGFHLLAGTRFLPEPPLAGPPDLRGVLHRRTIPPVLKSRQGEAASPVFLALFDSQIAFY